MYANEIAQALSTHKRFDEELWNFAEQVHKRRLVNLSEKELQARLFSIEKAICYLEPTPSSRLSLPPEHSWVSPWYWLRQRHWTISEFKHRSMEAPSPTFFDDPSSIRQEFHGLLRGGSKLLTRVSRLPWLTDTLTRGLIRLAPASSYELIENDQARTDDELVRQTKTPGDLVTITTENGRTIPIIGDLVRSSSRRKIAGNPELDYWLTSFSTELDPRLVGEFPSKENDDAILVIFDVMEFIQRCVPHLNKAATYSEKALEQIEYFDSFHDAPKHLSVRDTKDIRFAYQREWRLTVDPKGKEDPGDGAPLFIEIGSIADIAGIYMPGGERALGFGPSSFLE